MRNPDQLPNVLHNLLRHPGLKNLLRNPKALVIYLQTQAWPETPAEEEENGPWDSSVAPDSQEAQELAEVMPLVEEQLEALDLTPEQQTALKTGLVQVYPDCRETLEILLPDSSPALP